jgi:beta-lactamase regulating signal transducer with metallopeptidase domain
MIAVMVLSALRTLLLSLIAGFGLRVFRVSNPHLRLIVWSAVLAAGLMMPALTQWQAVSLPIAAPMAFPALIAHRAGTPPPAMAVEPPSARSAPNKDAQPRRAPGLAAIGWRDAITTAYCLVAALLLARLLLGVAATGRLVRRARRLDDGWSAGHDVRLSPAISVPVCFGRVILLPPAAIGWNAARRQAVLAHESAHVRRGDFFLLLAAALHQALFWFSPLAWWLRIRLAELVEAVCDDVAIEQTGDRFFYAQCLVDIAARTNSVAAAVPMARPATVIGRVERILAETVTAARPSHRLRLLMVAALVPLVLAAARLEVVAAENTEPPKEVPLDAKILDNYVGFYRADPAAVLDLVVAVTREGNHLLAGAAGMPTMEFIPESATRFFSEPSDSVMTIETDVQGRVARAIRHQDGRDIAYLPVSASDAKAADSRRAARLADQARPRHAVAVDPKLFDNYVGTYFFSRKSVVAVTREGNDLFMQLTGQPAFEVYPESDHDFFLKPVPAQISFLSDGSGKATALILHQMGIDQIANRTDAGAAEEANRLVAVKLAEQTKPRQEVAIDSRLLDNYVGRYQLIPGMIFTVTRDQSRLQVQLSGQPTFDVYASGDKEFFYKVVPAQLSFVTGADGKATKMILHQNGRDAPASRIE